MVTIMNLLTKQSPTENNRYSDEVLNANWLPQAMLAALGVSGLWLVISVIISATATALVVTVIAEVYSTVPEESALTAVVANGLSIFTLTGFVWGFQALGMV